MKHLFLKRGLVDEYIDRDARRLPKQDGFYDMQKWAKRVLNWLHIPYIDPCCDLEKTTSPVRYNTDTNILESYTLSTDTWDEVIIGGGTAVSAWVQVTTNTTLPVGQRHTLVNTTTGNVTITLPTPATSTGIYVIKKIDASANDVLFSQPIDGNASFALDEQYESVTLLSNGTAYFII